LRFAKRLLTESLDRLISAEQDERRRIALFLHDGPVQHLAGIALMIDAALASIVAGSHEEAKAVLGTALERQRETIRELRGLSFALEPVVLRDQGFGPALDELAAQIERLHGVRVDVDAESSGELGQTAQIAVYTIVRELLDQAVRRGHPTHVDVALHATPDGGVEATIVDDAEPERRRRSFEVIEERVKQLHGEVAVQAEAGAGTRVVVKLPSYATRR
jgi:signal transduction histidine kinase